MPHTRSACASRLAAGLLAAAFAVAGPASAGVLNPTSGAELWVQVFHPRAGASGRLPTLVLVPGGTNSSATFTDRRGAAQEIANQGFVVVVFDPDGRGQSEGEEDVDGVVQQDGLAAVVRWAATLEEVDAERLGIVSYSMGVIMASGALARQPDLPVRFLIDWEGPADRHDMHCQGAPAGRPQQFPDCDDESFWREREAVTWIARVEVPYQRLQTARDHVQPDVGHAIAMVDAAMGGVAPWVRLNRLAPNRTFDASRPPAMLPDSWDRRRDREIAGFARELLRLTGR